MTAHTSRALNPRATFSGRYNPPPLSRPPLPAAVGCHTCAGIGEAHGDRCTTCSGTGRVVWVAGSAYAATLRGERYARQAMRREVVA